MAITGRSQVRLNKGKLAVYFDKLTNELTENAARTARQRARDIITMENRVRTGEMRRDIKIEKTKNGRRVVATSDHAIFQEKGVKPFGPKKPGGVLVFMPKGSRQVVFAKRVRGFEGIHFMERAMRSLSLRDFKKRT